MMLRKKISNLKIYSVLPLFFFIFFLAPSPLAQTTWGQNMSKIDTALQQEMINNKEQNALPLSTTPLSEEVGGRLLRINIVLNAQYDQIELRNKANTLRSKEAKRNFVVNELKNFSKETQKELLSFLSTFSISPSFVGGWGKAVEKVQSFWISNSINCYATIEVIEQLSYHPDVLMIGSDKEQNLLASPQPSPKEGKNGSEIGYEEQFSSQSSSTLFPLEDVEKGREMTYNVIKVQADQVWELGYTGDGIVVAIIDSGVNYNHTDLQGNMWEHPDYPNHGWNYVNNNNNPMDDNGHGTHVAGTVAGQGASGSQTGIAPQAKIMALKVLNWEGSGSLSALVDAIQFAVEKGAHIINASLGFSGGGLPAARVMLRNSMNNVLEAGIVAAVAAGNDGISFDFFPPDNINLPGSCPPPWLHPHQTLQGGVSAVICVGSINESDVISFTSSRGPVTWQGITGYNDYPYNPGMGLIRPDIVAPGVDIKSLTHNSNNTYRFLSGTSMATPCVAGIIALMLSKNQYLTPAEISEILETTAYPLTSTKSNTYGSGRVNALNAINEVKAPIDIVFESLIINDEDGNNNGRLNPGETVHLTISLENLGHKEIENINVTLETESDIVSVNQEFASFGTMGISDIVTVQNAFTVTLSEEAKMEQEIEFTLIITSGNSICFSNFKIIVYDYRFEIEAVVIPKEEPLVAGETSDLLIYLKNTGNEDAIEVNGTISSSSYFLIINENEKFYGPLFKEQYKNRTYRITVAPNTPSSITGFNFKINLSEELGRVTEINSFINRNNSDSPPPACAGIENFSIEKITSSLILTWNISDENPLEKYLIYCNNRFVAETVSTTFIQEEVEDGDYNYCIEALYSNGCTSDLACIDFYVNIKDYKIQNEIVFYPNPFKDEIFIESEFSVANIEIVNALGQTVKKGKFDGKPINTTNLISGVYFVIIEGFEGDKTVRKMVKK